MVTLEAIALAGAVPAKPNEISTFQIGRKLRFKHRGRRFTRQPERRMVAVQAIEKGTSYPGEVAGRGPQAGRRHLGVDAPSAGRRHTVPRVRRRAARRQINRQRLCEGGVLQRQRLEDQLAHDRGQGMAAHICYRCLRNCCAATRIPELQARNEINDDWEIVGWRRAVQYLSYGWPWARGGVAGKSMNRHTAGVTEKLAKRDARSPVPIRWNTPRGQILLYVAVHCDMTVLTSRIAPSAKTGLLTEPAWNSVSAPTGSGLPFVRIPKPRSQATRPSSTTAILTPGEAK